MDSPLLGWERARRPADVTRRAIGDARYRRSLVGRSRPCPKSLGIQKAPRGLRLTTAQRSGRPRLLERGSPSCIREVLLGAEEQTKLSKLPPSSSRVLEAVLYRGNLARSAVPSVAGASTRTATRVVSALTEAGVLTSDTPYAPVRLAFPAALAERWMPGLFPEKRE